MGGPEGVHVDGATLGMILVARRENVKPETGGTRIWSAHQATGKPTAEDLESKKLLHHWKPSKVFDALFFLDESVRHEALEGELADPDRKGLPRYAHFGRSPEGPGMGPRHILVF